MSAVRPVEKRRPTDEQYYQFECSECGKTDQNSFCEPDRTQMLERRLCFICNHWVEEARKYERNHPYMTIIGGRVYGPGNRTSGSFRGMAGRRFDIEYIEPSAFAGKRITTFDLWSGGAMPDRLRERFADTARFLGGAEEANASGTVCWNPSDHRSGPYPLPQTLRGLK